MKDYSLNSEESKKFILNYEIQKNEKQIIVNLASKERYIIPYTIENEKKILNKMKEQVLKANDFTEKTKNDFNRYQNYFFYDNFLIIVSTISTMKNPVSIVAACGILLMIDAIRQTIRMKKCKKIMKDIDKQQMFLENEELLNEKIMSNSNVLLNTKEKTKDIVIDNKNNMFYSDNEEKKVFNLNNIDEIKYEELEKIIENIKRDEEFGFDYSSDSKEKVKVKEKVIYGQHEIN